MVETVKNVLKRAMPQKVHSKVSMNRLKILVTTVNRSKADFYMDYIQSFGANMQFVFYGHGKTESDTRYLRLFQTETWY